MVASGGIEQFYLNNAAKYQALVNALDTAPGLRIPTGVAGPNMIVSARIRPLAKDESFPSATFPRSIQRNVVDIHDLYNHPSGFPRLKSSNYEVDRLFTPDSTSEDIYNDLVVNLVPVAWNGGIATLFAYGQTGSGKTFTISKLEELFAETLMGGGMDGDREVYMNIIDLAGNAAFDLLNERKPVSLLEDSHGVTQMVGAEEHQVYNQGEMKTLIELATSFRRTAPTLKNDASSRSHAICRIRIRNPATDSDGLLYLIDLAGSESARDVTAHGADRMRETREINISLSVLKDCIRGKALANASGQRKPPHIPFRRSALTRVLKHVFDPVSTRPCKTIVIACVNPSLADVGPSKNTLRFAEMLRVLVTKHREGEIDGRYPMGWTNERVREWVRDNSGTPPILPNILAPRETGAQLLNLSSTEFEYRCQKSPGVKAKQAKEFRLKLWQVYIDAQQASGSLKETFELNCNAGTEE